MGVVNWNGVEGKSGGWSRQRNWELKGSERWLWKKMGREVGGDVLGDVERGGGVVRNGGEGGVGDGSGQGRIEVVFCVCA
jgi:hypothetical protein